MAVVRVKKDVAVAVFDVPGEESVVLAPDMPFDSASAVVRLHPEYFTSESEVTPRPRSVRVDEVEQATAAPGEKRAR